MLKLQGAKATLVGPINVYSQSTVPHGKSAKPVKCADVQVTLYLDASDHMKLVEKLFPACDVQAKTIAGRDECKGEVRKTNTKLGDMQVAIAYGGGQVIDTTCEVKSAPQLHINEDGNAKLVVKPRFQIPVKDVESLLEVINADVTVSLQPAQVDLSDLTELAVDDPNPKHVKEAKLKAVGADPF